MKALTVIDRRAFVAGAGLSFLSCLSGRAGDLLQKSDTVFASAFKGHDGSYGAILLNEEGEEISRLSLPGRGHDVTFDPVSGRGVVFARRPGNFALIFHVNNAWKPEMILARPDRHFYGHGVFSHDGKLLYATENDYENARGIVGIYDATNRFERIGEFSSHGTGPHEILLHDERNVLIVANGGIETHPDFRRAKLNIPTMQPSLVFLDSRTGEIIEKHTLPPGQHKLSIRHMDISTSGKVYFGCQYEGSNNTPEPLVGVSELGAGIRVFNLPESVRVEMGVYVGSVALASDGNTLAVTLPKVDRLAVFSTEMEEVMTMHVQPQASGIASTHNGFVSTLVQGALTGNSGTKEFHDIYFDNHLSKST